MAPMRSVKNTPFYCQSFCWCSVSKTLLCSNFWAIWQRSVCRSAPITFTITIAIAIASTITNTSTTTITITITIYHHHHYHHHHHHWSPTMWPSTFSTGPKEGSHNETINVFIGPKRGVPRWDHQLFHQAQKRGPTMRPTMKQLIFLLLHCLSLLYLTLA